MNLNRIFGLYTIGFLAVTILIGIAEAVFGLGSMGVSRPSMEAITEADLILLLGTRVNFNLGFGQPPFISEAQKIVQVDIEPEEIDANRRVDLGLVGLGLLLGFFWEVYRALAAPRHRALFFACLAALVGAYPIVTPHVWLALALMAGLGLAARRKQAAA